MDESDCKAAHDCVVASAKGLPFLDALNKFHYYNFFHRTFGPLPNCDAIDVTAQFPDKAPKEIEEGLARLRSLYADAVKSCEASWGLPKEKQIEEIGRFYRANSDVSEELCNLAQFYGSYRAVK